MFHDKEKHLILPVGEFFTTANDSKSISTYLCSIKLELLRTIPKSVSYQLAPIIVTDFSWGLINAVMETFNYTTADVYVNWCFEILFNKEQSIVILSVMKTILYLCSSHFIKLIVKKVRKIKKYGIEVEDKKLQNAFIFTFSLLQNAVTVADFSKNIKHAFNVFNLQFVSKKFINSCEELKKQLLERNLTVITLNNEDKVNTQIVKKETKQKTMITRNVLSLRRPKQNAQLLNVSFR